MKTVYLLQELDGLQVELDGGVDTLWAVHECMDHGHNRAEDYNNALFGAYCLLKRISKELRAIIDNEHEQRGGAA